ncbi:hypothetical protein RCL_jg9221.t1 [Rhizophagus clarus]|uniref:Uncharacterized protein n=1 Tax=Rhizophagus clarus TaxID=94130 RepID=A0A8H3M4X2_9GLOM|nr:hypothetical protein RCL_jg9221.t1 [Rhizophagus clarus]
MTPKKKATPLIEQLLKVEELQVHFAKDCIDVDDDARRIFVRNILRLYGNDDDVGDENNKHQRFDQPIFEIRNITKNYQNQYKTQ